jgi:hypothetical protein
LFCRFQFWLWPQPLGLQVCAPTLASKIDAGFRMPLAERGVRLSMRTGLSIDFKHFILLIANTGVKPGSGYSSVFTSVDTGSNKMVTSVHVIEMSPGNCPAFAVLMGSVSYALIPQTTNEIRFVVTKADSNCASPVNPPFIK